MESNDAIVQRHTDGIKLLIDTVKHLSTLASGSILVAMTIIGLFYKDAFTINKWVFYTLAVILILALFSLWFSISISITVMGDCQSEYNNILENYDELISKYNKRAFIGFQWYFLGFFCIILFIVLGFMLLFLSK